MITAMVSGGFDPVHIGHIIMFREAKQIADRLIVLINNDNWLKKKKGRAFMSEEDRREIIKSLEMVDQVILTGHKENPEDMSVATEIRQICPDIFCNGGDRNEGNIPTAEEEVCKELNIIMEYNIGGEKIRSSSELIKKSEPNLGRMG